MFIKNFKAKPFLQVYLILILMKNEETQSEIV